MPILLTLFISLAYSRFIGNVIVNEGETKIVDEVIKVDYLNFHFFGFETGTTRVFQDEIGFITQKGIEGQYNSLTQVCSLSLCITQYLDGNTWKDYENPIATETITDSQLFPFTKGSTTGLLQDDYYFGNNITHVGQKGTLTMTRYWKCQYSGLNGSYTDTYFYFEK